MISSGSGVLKITYMLMFLKLFLQSRHFMNLRLQYLTTNSTSPWRWLRGTSNFIFPELILIFPALSSIFSLLYLIRCQLHHLSCSSKKYLESFWSLFFLSHHISIRKFMELLLILTEISYFSSPQLLPPLAEPHHCFPKSLEKAPNWTLSFTLAIIQSILNTALSEWSFQNWSKIALCLSSKLSNVSSSHSE